MSNPNASFATDSPLLLIQRAQSGDQAAFEELLVRYSPLIESMTQRFGRSNATLQDREDLRQEAVICFFKALRHFDTLQSEVSFGVYAKECIRNGLISYLRVWKKHENVVLLEDNRLLDETPSQEDPASRIVEVESYLEILQRICAALSEQENRIWSLYLAGRTAKEIAALTGKNEKSVQNAIYRIRKKLRSVLPYS